MKYLFALSLLFVAGCNSPVKRAGGVVMTALGAKPVPTAGGSGPSVVGGETVVTMTAPENPATGSTQNVERVDEKSTVIMAPVERVTETTAKDGTVTRVVETLNPVPVILSKTVQKSGTSVGTTQVDTGAITAAKLGSMKSVQYVGILLILVALAAFHPLVGKVLGSRTLQAGLGVGGLALVALPNMVVGNETQLLRYGFVVVIMLLAWYFIHRHGKLQGFVDANGDGIDDKLQK